MSTTERKFCQKKKLKLEKRVLLSHTNVVRYRPATDELRQNVKMGAGHVSGKPFIYECLHVTGALERTDRHQ